MVGTSVHKAALARLPARCTTMNANLLTPKDSGGTLSGVRASKLNVHIRALH